VFHISICFWCNHCAQHQMFSWYSKTPSECKVV
jgi:hypothetical protein